MFYCFFESDVTLGHKNLHSEIKRNCPGKFEGINCEANHFKTGDLAQQTLDLGGGCMS